MSAWEERRSRFLDEAARMLVTTDDPQRRELALAVLRLAAKSSGQTMVVMRSAYEQDEAPDPTETHSRATKKR